MANKNAPWMKLGERLYAVLQTAGLALAFLYPLALQINYATAASGAAFNAIRYLYHRLRRPWHFIPSSPEALIKNNEHHKASSRGAYNFMIFAATTAIVTQIPFVALNSTAGLVILFGNFVVNCSMTIFKNQKIHHLDNKYLPHALMTDFNIEIICKDRYPKGSISRSYRVILQALDIDKEANGIYLMDAGQKPSSTNDRGQSIGAPRPPVEPFPGAQTGQATPPPYQSLAPNHIPPIYQGYSPEHQRPPAFNPECLDDSDEYDHLDMPPPFNPNGGH